MIKNQYIKLNDGDTIYSLKSKLIIGNIYFIYDITNEITEYDVVPLPGYENCIGEKYDSNKAIILRNVNYDIELADLEWRNVKDCYLGETAYGIKVFPGTADEGWGSGYKDYDIWGVITIRTTPSLENKFIWQDKNNKTYYRGNNLTNSPFFIKQSDGTYLFIPTLLIKGKINYDSAAVNEYYLVKKSEPIKHT